VSVRSTGHHDRDRASTDGTHRPRGSGAMAGGRHFPSTRTRPRQRAVPAPRAAGAHPKLSRCLARLPPAHSAWTRQASSGPGRSARSARSARRYHCCRPPSETRFDVVLGRDQIEVSSARNVGDEHPRLVQRASWKDHVALQGSTADLPQPPVVRVLHVASSPHGARAKERISARTACTSLKYMERLDKYST